MERPRFRRQAQDGLEVVQRHLRLAIDVDHVAQFLQRPENEKRIDEQRKELPYSDALREDQVEHEEQDRGAQQVNAGALYEAQAAQVAHLLQFQLENLGGGGVETLDLLPRQAQALHQLDIAQRFGGGASQRGGLAHDVLLHFLDLAAQHLAQPAEQRHGRSEEHTSKL